MNQTMLTITEARQSKSGKTLGIKDHTGKWYTTKCWELQGMIGQAIYAETSVSSFNGNDMTWINEYRVGGQQQGPAQQAPVPQYGSSQYDKPHVQAAQQQMNETVRQRVDQPPQPPTVNRDASIFAQAMCKSITFTDPKIAFNAWCYLYGAYEDWASRPDAEQQEIEHGQQHTEQEYGNQPPY